jgi:hypothetical protein
MFKEYEEGWSRAGKQRKNGENYVGEVAKMYTEQ